MQGSKTGRKPDDLSRVNLHETWEIEYWCAHFDTTPEHLRAAVDRAGPSTAEIERELKAAGRAAFQNTGED